MSKKVTKCTLVTLAVILALAAILAPVGFVLGMTFLAPKQYSKTFYGALDEKYDRLTSLEEDKIVVVGGSSVAFGLDSELLGRYMNMPVVNFGLYADLGTKLMLDLSRDHIKEGDIVILAPELDSQTLSMYFNWDTTLKAFDDDMSMLRELDLSVDEWLFSIGGFWNLAASKFSYIVNGTTPDPNNVYRADSFNEYGDIDGEKYPRPNNIMKNYYDPKDSALVKLDPSIMDGEFLAYLNEYITECEAKGATVYFTWCPVNDLAVPDKEKATVRVFESFFKENLECEVISSLSNYIIDSHYFYDTNFHLNDAGVLMRTLLLLDDLLLTLDPEDERTLAYVSEWENEVLYNPPEYKYSATYDGEYDPNAEDFVFRQLPSGAYEIIGLSEVGKTKKELTVPLCYKSGDDPTFYKVTLMNTDIFAGSAAERLIVTEDTCLGGFVGSFTGGKGLLGLWIYMADDSEISPPTSFSGVGADFRIHTPRSANYKNGYNWGDAFGSLIVEDI